MLEQISAQEIRHTSLVGRLKEDGLDAVGVAVVLGLERFHIQRVPANAHTHKAFCQRSLAPSPESDLHRVRERLETVATERSWASSVSRRQYCLSLSSSGLVV